MIRFAKLTDVDNIMQFIDTYWKKGHIMGTNKGFFLYQHSMIDELSYVINELEDGTINAVLGYIPYGGKNRDVMLALWKVEKSDDAMLGINMLMFLINNVDARIVSCPGINRKTRGIYEYLGYYTGKMKHWYRLNKKDSYKIADIKNSLIPNTKDYEDYMLTKIETFNDLEKNFDLDSREKEFCVPFKENEYIKKRYFEHPMYKYDVYSVQYKGKSELVVITRVVDCNNSKIVRIIDCIGNFEHLTYITKLLDDILQTVDAEYIDFYETGIKDDIFNTAGWLDVNETENIIPEYFSPYECKNIDIYYFSTQKDIVLFKGDGDQDRPN